MGFTLFLLVAFIPVGSLLFFLGWSRGYDYHLKDVSNWGIGFDEGWNDGWERGFDAGYMCGIQDRRKNKDKELLKEHDESSL